MAKSLDVTKSNNDYLLRFAKKLRAAPQEILASAAVAGYKAAVKHTYMDSGQFAFNWQIGIGSAPNFEGVWHTRGKYGEKKGAKLSDKGDMSVYFEMMQDQGIPARENAPLKGASLFKEVVRRRVTSVSLTNPLWNDHYGPYASRAAIRPGYMVHKEIRAAISRAAYQAVRKWGEK